VAPWHDGGRLVQRRNQWNNWRQKTFRGRLKLKRTSRVISDGRNRGKTVNRIVEDGKLNSPATWMKKANKHTWARRDNLQQLRDRVVCNRHLIPFSKMFYSSTLSEKSLELWTSTIAVCRATRWLSAHFLEPQRRSRRRAHCLLPLLHPGRLPYQTASSKRASSRLLTL
jgi:hypothetical protein